MACGVFFSALVCATWHELSRELLGDQDNPDMEFIVRLVIPGVLTVQAFLGFFAPVVLAGEFLVMYLINYVTAHLREWKQRLEAARLKAEGGESQRSQGKSKLILSLHTNKKISTQIPMQPATASTRLPMTSWTR